MKRALSALAIAVAAFATPVVAIEPHMQCGASLAITPHLVEASGQSEFRQAITPGDGPALLFGAVSPMRDIEGLGEGLAGTILFVRDDAETWRALFPSPWESEVALYATGEDLALFTQIQTEGPGQSWTLVRTKDGFLNLRCAVIAFPTELNQPNWANEFLDLVDFDIGADGRGELIGAARLDRDGREIVRHYLYRTHDDGQTWSPPVRISLERAARGGRFAPVELAPASVGVIAELHSFAAP